MMLSAASDHAPRCAMRLSAVQYPALRRRRLNKARTSAESASTQQADLVRVADAMRRSAEAEAAAHRGELTRQEQVRCCGGRCRLPGEQAGGCAVMQQCRPAYE